jgi:hypothetical protein
MSVIALALLAMLQEVPPAMPPSPATPVTEQQDARQKSYAMVGDINTACERALKAVRIGQPEAAQVEIDNIIEKLFWLKDNAPLPSVPKARKAGLKELIALKKDIAAIDAMIARGSKNTNDRMTQFQHRLAQFAKTSLGN